MQQRLATTVLLINQNKLIEIQNNKIDIQNALSEGQRRSSLVLLMETILEDISKEIDFQVKSLNEDEFKLLESRGYSLSTPLIGRISSVSQGFQPYRILNNGILTEREYSPERAQLLLALIGSNIDSVTLTNIYRKTSFSHSYLINAKLDGAFLEQIDLRQSNLSGASLIDCKLFEADLSNSIMIETDLYGCYAEFSNFDNTRMSNPIFRHALLSHSSFNHANIIDGDFSFSKMENIEIIEGFVIGGNFRASNLGYSSLYGSDFRNSDFEYSNLYFAELNNSDFSEANFENANLENSDFEYANLTLVNGLKIEHLLKSISLFKTRGIKTSEDFLTKAKPCLFEEQKCLPSLDLLYQNSQNNAPPPTG